MTRIHRRLTAALLAAVSTALPAPAQDGYQYPSKVNVSWDRLNDYDELTKICRELATAYPDLLTMQSIGKSVQGRDMWELTLNVAKTGRDTEKPAMYIDGNVHGNEVQAAETVLYSIWYLTKSYGKVEQLTQLMDRAAFYFLPTVNPDGRAYWFANANTDSSSRGGQRPVDDDGDGLFDEDPPNDIDGDGQLLQMRKEDPNGRWRESADDPRILEIIPPDAKGDFKRYTRYFGGEGLDDDGDGRVNEDGPGGYDPNRDWPADWQPDYIQGGALEYPLRLPESKCIADFILAHPNIAAVQSYHNAAGMMLRGPGAEYVDYPPQDVAVYDRIGQRGERILPLYKYSVIYRDLYTVHGGFIDWTAEELGIISFTNELWTGRKYYYEKEEAERGPEAAKAQMDFNDLLMFGQTFVPWKKFRHPVYGDVELGGWVKMQGRVPPSFQLEDECHRNFAFTMFHAGQMPLVEITNVEVASLGGGLTRVRADVKNSRIIPTTTGQAARRQYGPRDRVELSGKGVEVVAGGFIGQDRYTTSFDFVEHQPARLWLDYGVPSEGVRSVQWIVRGSGEATIRFSGPRAKAAVATVTIAP